MILEVLKYPDPRLREVSQPVTEFKSDLVTLSKDMLETMYSEKGIGLAAPQVGSLQRMLVIDCRPKSEKGRYSIEDLTDLEKKIEQPLILINPVIQGFRGNTTFDEGCLSVPTFFETVERHEFIEVAYQDLKGQRHVIRTDGLLAIVIQHEMDHLEGTLFIDHLSYVKSQKIKKIIKKSGYPPKNKSDNNDSEDAESSKENHTL